MRFHLKYDWELSTKEVEDFLSFPTGSYLPASDQRLSHYELLQANVVAENYKRKIKPRAVQMGFFP
jgi:hypothetical protein